MKFIYSFCIISVTLIVFSSCFKDNTGTLIVTYVDESNKPVQFGDIFIYENEIDFHDALFLTTLKTDGKGEVEFNKLIPGIYYFDVTHIRPSGLSQTLMGKAEVFPGQVTEGKLAP